ncbi:TIGR03808 family TAT-translocated repetitive protein [Faunimonas sp. B44]|uniref:TIGR03808 family TAT-translocated repetitive protein n=1 Tax=Faunimonas sp. B44 TaxID=3461493 RepID=UPI004044C264
MVVQPSRRAVLAGLAAAAASAGSALAERRALADMRGSFDASEGVRPRDGGDQSAALRDALVRAEATGRPVFMPPGRYEIADIDLTPTAKIVGIPGETRLVFRGGNYLLRAEGTKSCRLDGLILDGAGRALADGIDGLLHCSGLEAAIVEDCAITGSSASGVALAGCAGRVARSSIDSARVAGIRLVQSRGMAVTENDVSDCGDTGILIHRYDEGADDTIVRGNRVSRIRARSGGTGQFGNGINLAKANGVIVSDNRIDDCDFSAIRCFSSDDLQVTGNICTRSGETALYVEFAFEGAIVSGNLIDDAALGISFANLMDYGGRLGVCSGNLIRNMRGHTRLPNGGEPVGAGISAEADIAVTGNVVENAWIGLQLGWGPYLRDVSATGNVIRRTRIGIGVSVVEGAGPALISGNLISGAGKGAILGMRWAEAVTGDLARGGAERFPHLTVALNRAD